VSVDDPRNETTRDKVARIIQEGHVLRRTSYDIAGDVLELMAAAAPNPFHIPSRLLLRRPPWAFSSARLLAAIVIAAIAAIVAIAALKPSAPRPLESAASTERFERVWTQGAYQVIRDKATGHEYLLVYSGAVGITAMYPASTYTDGYHGRSGR
jgi:hypothetical protein